MKENHECENSQNLQKFREGAAASGLGAAGFILGFFSPKINIAVGGSFISVAISALKSILESDVKGMAFNILGGLLTDYLALFLRYGMKVSTPYAFLTSAIILTTGTEVAEVYYNENRHHNLMK